MPLTALLAAVSVVVAVVVLSSVPRAVPPEKACADRVSTLAVDETAQRTSRVTLLMVAPAGRTEAKSKPLSSRVEEPFFAGVLAA
jgi:hypothetical protein